MIREQPMRHGTIRAWFVSEAFEEKWVLAGLRQGWTHGLRRARRVRDERRYRDSLRTPTIEVIYPIHASALAGVRSTRPL